MIRSAVGNSCCRCRQLLPAMMVPASCQSLVPQHSRPSTTNNTTGIFAIDRRISTQGVVLRQSSDSQLPKITLNEDFYQFDMHGSVHRFAAKRRRVQCNLINVSVQNDWSNLPRILHRHSRFSHLPLQVGLQRRTATIRWNSSSNNSGSTTDQNSTKSPFIAGTATADSSLTTGSLKPEKSALSTGSLKPETTAASAKTPETMSSNSRENVSPADSSLHEANHAHSGGKGVSDAVVAATQELEQRIKRVVRGENLTIGDQLSVALIAIFTTILLAAPYAVRHMKQSANTVHGYEDRLQTDDPVDEFVKLARHEWNMVDGNVDDEETNNGNDEKNQKFIDVVLKDVLESKTVQKAAQEFVVQIIESERFQSTIQHFVKELWNDLITDPETVAQVIKLLEIAITSTPIKNAVIELILQIAVRETEFRDAMIQMIQNLGVDVDVQNAVVKLLTEATHTTLNDPDIFDHSMEFATDVVGDDIVQQTAGEALRKSVEHAVKPATTIILSACGVGLLIFSFIALGYSRSSETEARVFASAARSLQSNAAIGMSRILNWPFRALPNAIKRGFNTIYNCLSIPLHQVSSKVCDGLCSFAVNAIKLSWNGIQTALYWLSSKSSKILQSISASMYAHAATTTNWVGIWIATSAIEVTTLMENGIRTIVTMTGYHTLQAFKYVGRGILTITVYTGTYISKSIANFISVILSSMKSYDEW